MHTKTDRLRASGHLVRPHVLQSGRTSRAYRTPRNGRQCGWWDEQRCHRRASDGDDWPFANHRANRRRLAAVRGWRLRSGRPVRRSDADRAEHTESRRQQLTAPTAKAGTTTTKPIRGAWSCAPPPALASRRPRAPRSICCSAARPRSSRAERCHVGASGPAATSGGTIDWLNTVSVQLTYALLDCLASDSRRQGFDMLAARSGMRSGLIWPSFSIFLR